MTIVDYLQLAHTKAENKTQEITEVSRQLKTAGLELGKISGGTLIAIAQLNRAVELRSNRRRQLSDLRESGQIEQDADVVMFVSTDLSTVKGPSDPHVKNIDIAKQKNGPLDTVRLVFLPQIAGFEEATGAGVWMMCCIWPKTLQRWHRQVVLVPKGARREKTAWKELILGDTKHDEQMQ